MAARWSWWRTPVSCATSGTRTPHPGCPGSGTICTSSSTPSPGWPGFRHGLRTIRLRTAADPMRILWMSDSPIAFTGFGTVTREILGRFVRAGHEVAAIGWGHNGWPYDRRAFPYDIYPAEARLFGRDVLARVVSEFRPSVLIVLADAWMCEWLKDFQHEHPFKLILYTPIDGVPFPRVHVPLLLRADATVTCSRFGQKAALAACPDADVTMIYHGVDVDTFRPLGPKEEFQASQSLGGKFVVGCVARNQPRKLFPVLVKAFARFA